jgi:hypothetical protein
LGRATREAARSSRQMGVQQAGQSSYDVRCECNSAWPFAADRIENVNAMQCADRMPSARGPTLEGSIR